ncbi:MAG: methyltransferase [Kiritimatiellae bacterium]|nr:methyltransferase [Kiritimatiellia bacterium]
MTPRERVRLALDHKEPDRVPLDLGASAVTGMHVSMVYRLRQALGLGRPGTPVKVVEPYQMLGDIAPDLMEALSVDVVGLPGPTTLFGFKNENWKPWTMADGTPTLVPESFNTIPEPNGDLLQYPEGDRSVPPSGRMPKGGYFFDSIIRQPPLDEDRLCVEDNLEEFGQISKETLAYFQREAERLYTQTDKAILANFGGTAFGDIALVPAPWLKHPKGIRDIEEWYVSTQARPDFVHKIFERQCEIALANLEKIHQVVGNRVTAVFLTGTDFGCQNGPFISLESYRRLFKPFHHAVNDWIHRHTTWKTFNHSCGSVRAFIPDFIEAGFDILNPVQCSATGMEPEVLKDQHGDQITFWGGGVDTQRVLPFGTPADVRRQVHARLRFFAPGGGFVFDAIHNIQAGTPMANVQALYKALKEFGRYPIK